MKILLAASEVVPFCKTGGLADVAGALPLALKAQKHSVRVVVPKYRDIKIDRFGIKDTGIKFLIPMGDVVDEVTLWEGKLDNNIPAYFIGCDKYFDRNGLYRGSNGNDFPDNDERFILFSRAVLEAAKAVDFKPDIIHCHDWQTGLIPAYLATLYRIDAFFRSTATVFTIHNIAYQGAFPKSTLFRAGFPWYEFTPDKLEFYGQISFLKAGMVYATVINTVSPTYVRETMSGPEFGRGMEGVLIARKDSFFGITNGLDVAAWDPAKDEHLAAPFTKKSLEKKRLCKKDLQTRLGLKADDLAPLIGMVSRLDDQKGFDMVAKILPQIIDAGAQLVILGVGSPHYHDMLNKWCQRYPQQVAVSLSFDDPLAHRIYGGCDIFLMPSRFEPCGLGQMIAMRYGAIPVVTPTGGLSDTVEPYISATNSGAGFVARSISAEVVWESLSSAMVAYRRPKDWVTLQNNAMSKNFSWNTSVKKYVELYKQALERVNIGSRRL